MSKNVIALLALLATTGLAQSRPTSQSAPAATRAAQSTSTATSAQVQAGTEIHAVLDTPLSTRTSKAGDRFTATISDPVRASDGSVVVPPGARIEGEIAEMPPGRSAPALRGKGQLSLHFRDIVLPNGESLPLAATLISVNSTSGRKPRADEESVRSGAQGKDVSKDAGVGAGLERSKGLTFGGPMKGLAIGAQAGGGSVLATKGKDVNLAAETGLVIRLDQPISIAGVTAPR